jgi:pimeloyl-ACP methyl ester carboxylesterase
MMRSEFLLIEGRRIEYVRYHARHSNPNLPTLVFLHEGLGSVAMWRDFPALVSDTTGCEVLVYSRVGYGKSDPIDCPRSVRYMHDEALVTLPRILDHLGVTRPVLLGHSDGGSIALIHAGVAGSAVAGLILIAPHVFVEDVTVSSIAHAKVAFDSTDLPQRLARYHDDVNSAFRGWSDIWLHPDFRQWNIEEYLQHIACPILALQGEDDEYGTMAQIDRIGMQAKAAKLMKLAACGHAPHRQRPNEVAEAIRTFVAGLAQ